MELPWLAFTYLYLLEASTNQNIFGLYSGLEAVTKSLVQFISILSNLWNSSVVL